MKLFFRNFVVLSIILTVSVAAILIIWNDYVSGDHNRISANEKYIVGLILTDEEDSWHATLNNDLTNIENGNDIEVMTIRTNRTQAAQIEALRSFISYKVNVIIFSPVMENGWDFVLDEAKEAKIPIITVEKKLSQLSEAAEDSQVYYVGYDYAGLGIEMANVIESQWKAEKPRVVELQGTVASSTSREITQGIRSILDKNKQYQFYYSIGANYMRSRANELITGLIRNDYTIDIIISHNDAMTLGVLDALKKYDIHPNEDIYVFGCGGESEVHQAFLQGDVHCLVRLNPDEITNEVKKLVHLLKQDDALNEKSKTRIFQGELLVGKRNDTTDEETE